MPGMGMLGGMSLGSAVMEITGDSSGAIQAINDTQSHLGASIFVFRTAGYALQAIGQAALSGFADASKAAGDFNQSMVATANLTSIADYNIKTVHDSLLKMATETGKTPMELADGFYYAASVLNNLNDALAVTEAAAKGSAIGLGTVSDITRVLTGVMNVYGFTAKDTNHLMDVLITMVKDGAGEANQFAGAIGRIIPIAKVAGVSFEDVAAALATATRAGLSVDEATTAVTRTLTELIGSSATTNKELATLGFSTMQINGAMVALGNTTATITDKLTKYGVSGVNSSKILKEMETNTALAEKTMRGLGLTTAQIQAVEQTHGQAVDALRTKLIPYGMSLNDIDSVLKAFTKDQEEGRLALGKYGISSEELRNTLKGPDGLNAALQLIMEKTGGNDAELRKIFPNIRGFIGILATAGTQGAEYNKILAEMHSGTDLLNADFTKTTQTQAFAQQQATATLDALKIKTGEAIAPALIAFLHALTPLLVSIGDFATQHPTAFADISYGILILAGGLYTLGAAAQAAAGWIAISRAFQVIGDAAMKIGPIAGAVSALGNAFKVAGAFVLGSGGLIILLIAGIILVGYLLITHWNELSTLVKSLGILIGTFFVEVWGKLTAAIGSFFSGVGTKVQEWLKDVGGFFSWLGKSVHGTWDALWNWVGDRLSDVGRTIGGFFSALGSLVQKGLKAFGDEWKALPGQIWGAIKKITGDMAWTVGHDIKVIIDAFKSVMKFIMGIPLDLQIAWMAIPIIVETVWSVVTATVGKWASQLGTHVHKMWDDVSNNTTTSLTSFWNWVQDAWKNGVKAVRDFIIGFPGFIAKIWLDSYTWTLNLVTTTWNWIVSYVAQRWHDLGVTILGIPGAIGKVWDDVRSYAQTQWGNILTDVGNLLGGIWSTITNWTGSIGNAIKDLAGNIWTQFKKGLGISSPSFIERAFSDIVKSANIAVGTVNGAVITLNAATPRLTAASSGLLMGGLATGGVAPVSTTSSGGLHIGKLTVNNPSSEVDIISAMNRAQWLARMQERGITPPTKEGRL